MPIDSYTKLLIESELSGTADYCLDFDGDDDYVATSAVTFPQGTDLSNYSIGCWFKPTDLSVARDIFCQSTERVAGGLQYIGSFRLFINTDGTISLQYQVSLNSKDGNHYIQSTDSVLLNKWNHVIVARNSTNYKIFLNGKVAYNGGVGSAKFNALISQPTYVRIGRWDPSYDFKGRISQVGMWQNDTLTEAEALEMYSNPNADWSSDFGNYSSSSSLVGYWRLDEGTGTSCADSAGSNTGTLTNMDENTDWINEAKLTYQLFEDLSDSDHTITAYGSLQHNNGQAKFGSYSIYCEGGSNSNYLSIADSNDWYFSGDFTIDCWLYPLDNSLMYNIIEQWQEAYYRWQITRNNDKTITLNFYNSTSNQLGLQTTGNYLENNTWSHLAVVRSGNNFKIFINGTEAASTTQSFTAGNYGAPVYIGRSAYTASYNPFKGYMENVRISNGIARWTSNFTPPEFSYSKTHKISGSMNDSGRVLVLNETDWTVESHYYKSPSTYEAGTVSGTKTIVGINTHGEVVGYGNVVPIEI